MTEVLAEDGPRAPAPSRESRVRSAARAIATRVRNDLLTIGEIAELKRMSGGSVGGPAFWRLAALDLEPRGVLAPEQEPRWLSAACLIAMVGSLHAPHVNLGAALAAADLSEQRLFKLLRSTGTALDDAARIAAHYLATKGVAVDAADLAELVVEDPASDRGESLRRRIARSYYATRHRSANEPTSGDQQ